MPVSSNSDQASFNSMKIRRARFSCGWPVSCQGDTTQTQPHAKFTLGYRQSLS